MEGRGVRARTGAGRGTGRAGAAARPGASAHLVEFAAVAAIASLLLLAGGSVMAHALGYVLGSLVTLGLLVADVRVSAARRNRPGFRGATRLARFGPVVAGLGVLAAAGHAWALATRLAG